MTAVRAHKPFRLHRFVFVGLPLALLSLGFGPPLSAQGGGEPGDQLWAARLSSPGDYKDQAFSLGTSPDGTVVFVTGGLAGQAPDGSDYGTVAYDATTGTQLWARRFDGGIVAVAYELAVSPDGAVVFVTGVATDRFGTIAYDALSGATMWVKEFRRGTQAYDLALSPDGAMVFVTGLNADGETGYDYSTVAYDAGTGTQLWASPYDGRKGNDFEADLAVSPDGARVFVTGTSPEPLGDDDYATIAYDAATGSQLWVSRMSVPNRDDLAQALAVSPDGTRVFVTGYGEGGYFITVAYDASTGAQLWIRRDDHGMSAYALGVSPDGSQVFVAGTDGLRYVTVAYDAATGAPVWLKKNSTGESVSSLDVSADGATVYVTGRGSADGYATVAYDAGTGAQQWVSLYNGPGGNDWTSDLASSPDGARVFVTGESAGLGGAFAFDYATVAYEA